MSVSVDADDDSVVGKSVVVMVTVSVDDVVDLLPSILLDTVVGTDCWLEVSCDVDIVKSDVICVDVDIVKSVAVGSVMDSFAEIKKRQMITVIASEWVSEWVSVITRREKVTFTLDHDDVCFVLENKHTKY